LGERESEREKTRVGSSVAARPLSLCGVVLEMHQTLISPHVATALPRKSLLLSCKPGYNHNSRHEPTGFWRQITEFPHNSRTVRYQIRQQSNTWDMTSTGSSARKRFARFDWEKNIPLVYLDSWKVRPLSRIRLLSTLQAIENGDGLPL